MSESPPRESLFAARLSACYECGLPFPQPVSVEQARADWGDDPDLEEVAYCCQGCADDFDGTAANAR